MQKKIEGYHPDEQTIKDHAAFDGVSMLIAGEIGMLPRTLDSIGTEVIWMGDDSGRRLKVLDINVATGMTELSDGCSYYIEELRDAHAVEKYVNNSIKN